jgi:NAD(P)H-hydrate epimerase
MTDAHNEPITIDIDFLKTIPLPDYEEDADKADYGKLLLIAGSRRLPGAAILAARAALRTGCGSVRVAAPLGIATQIAIAVPELMVIPLPETANGTIARAALDQVREQYRPCDAAVIGPGLDNDPETDDFARRLSAECPLPSLIDAQGLTALAGTPLKLGSGNNTAARILTPHVAEMSALLQRDEAEIEKAREAVATAFAREHHITLVLKGRETLVAAPGGEFHKNTSGTRGLGTAGSGDVLAGIIGSFLTQGLDATRAACWGVHLHALAGEALEKELGDDGITASDIVRALPNAQRFLRRSTSRAATSGPRPGLRRNA